MPPAEERGSGARSALLLPLGLLLATLVTTTWAGARFVGGDPAWQANPTAGPLAWLFGDLLPGLPFSAALMAILFAHEMGHFVFARRHRVPASLPYFLPMPFGIIGTFGAVIRMPPTPYRNALVDIGAAGPLAGLAVALPVLAYGIHLSPVAPLTPGPHLLEGNSILYLALKALIKGQLLPTGGVDINLHPIAWAGWVGLLVTMINLMPIGQLDGGHIAFAYFGDRQNRASLWLHRALLPFALIASAFAIAKAWNPLPLSAAIALGWPAGMPWAIWWIVLRLVRRLGGGEYHPPVGHEPLTPSRRRLCWIMGAVFLLIVTPIPLRTLIIAGE